MKTLKELLEITKEEFNYPTLLRTNKFRYLGLCDVFNTLDIEGVITKYENNELQNLMHNYLKKRSNRIFYSNNYAERIKIGDADRYAYAWKEGEKRPRNRWLNNQIKLNS